MVVKVSKGDGAVLKASFYCMDQGGQGMTASSVTLQFSTVKSAIAAIGGAYGGKMTPDGNSIAGQTQGGNPIPLNLKRATPKKAWPIPEPPVTLKPIPTDADAVFEVATIKPSRPKALTVRARNLVTMNTSLTDLITFVYELHEKQLVGASSWMETDRYDITAQRDGTGAANQKQLQITLRKLLADRFKLAFRREKKELSVYANTVAKSGSKRTKSEADPNGLPGLMFRGLGVLPVPVIDKVEKPTEN